MTRGPRRAARRTLLRAVFVVASCATAGCRAASPAAHDGGAPAAGPVTAPAATGAPRAPATRPTATVPTRDPAADARAAVRTARRFASAVAAAARGMIHAPTWAHGLLADVVARQYIAYHRVRA